MVKIAITCAVLLFVCQLSAGRSFEPETSAAFAIQSFSSNNNEPNLECAQVSVRFHVRPNRQQQQPKIRK